MEVYDDKSPRKKKTLQQILEEIIPEKMRWRLEVIVIIAQSGKAITGYRIVRKLIERGFKETGVSSVYPFLDVLVKAGLVEQKWKEVSEAVIITEKGKEVARLLRILI